MSAFPVIKSRLDRRSDAFAANRDANEQALAELEKHFDKARAGGGEKYIKRFRDRGKLLPRERVEALVDPGGYFLELCPLAGADVRGHHPGASIIGGVGVVSGVECMISASDATVKGGAINELGVQKT